MEIGMGGGGGIGGGGVGDAVLKHLGRCVELT